ncbi:23S rRNA (guanine(1835)-N(2))-methyltransferase RlmG [Tatumella ptyseos]|uniref:23S rRNA (guanine(1835)-N(2))-methyltransferase RlmG n=1 Tax=Tatumella ptyseos TaxID=82987 RepID=UPI0026E9A895|nr:23S rRNA (guanine(1835)-N(2))-methyltransferase RlmG [Tatumella ptyseos]WKX26057.1 23S rRNA (guanine(1835)-N(2))-methyltransferase RlmG [Tatumella ptyseos]
MNELQVSGQSLTLNRFPANAADPNLQAWDSADEYLLQQSLPEGPILVMNDNFGALTCGLQPRQVWQVSDSFISQQATLHNLATNEFPASNVRFLDSLAELPQGMAAVVIKIPKTLALLEHQLQALRQVVTVETIIIAAAKAKDIHKSTLELFEKWLGETHTSLAWKKSRLVFAKLTAEQPAANNGILSWPLENTPYTVHNHANVFARQSLDIGARLFLQHLPSQLEGTIVDLGCGNGVVGLLALEQNPEAKVHFVDESWMAVASSQLNVEKNLPDDRSRCEFTVNNSLSGFTGGSLQAVLCNPPFHQQSVITDHIAWQMFRDAKRCLGYGGELRVIGNRHLDYHRKLKKLFGNCQLIASDARFVVLRSVKL